MLTLTAAKVMKVLSKITPQPRKYVENPYLNIQVIQLYLSTLKIRYLYVQTRKNIIVETFISIITF